MSEQLKKRLLYLLLSLGVLLIWYRIISRVTSYTASEKEQVEESINWGQNVVLERKPEPDLKIMQDPFENASKPISPKVEEKKGLVKKVVAPPESKVKKEVKPAKDIPRIEYRGLVHDKLDKESVAFVYVNGKRNTVGEGAQLTKVLFLKKIWNDSILLTIYDKDTIIYR